MGPAFRFGEQISFVPEEAEEILRRVPAKAGVFALRGERETDQPYLMRATDVRRRMRRLLLPPETVDAEGRPVLSKRLNLRDRVRLIEWTLTGSEFESILLLYRATHALFGEAEARKRLRLHCPYFLRVTMEHQHPRVFVSNKMSRRALKESFGPFASRAAAERVAEAVGEQFKVRRCHEDLTVDPEHPGCVYGEMGRCLAPCQAAVSGQAYRAEADRVFAYLRTRGESLMAEVAAKRDAASEAMDFEGAATLHRQWEKVRAVAQSADPLVRAANEVRAVIVQAAADGGTSAAQEVSLFLLEGGYMLGPERLSTLGVRAVREQTEVGSSLFAQPIMLSAVPEGRAEGEGMSSPEERARGLLARLEAEAQEFGEPEPSLRGDALALFKRWYYRPEKQRQGEVVLPDAEGRWPVRRLLNAAARVQLGQPAAMTPVDREAAGKESVQERARARAEEPEQSNEGKAPAQISRSRKRSRLLSSGELVL